MNLNNKNGNAAAGSAPEEQSATSLSIRTFFVSSFLISCLTVTLVSCTATRRLIVQDNYHTISRIFVDSVEAMKGFGDIAFSFHGERYRGKLAVSVKEYNHFTGEFYTPFAQTIAAISSDGDSALITIDDRDYKISTAETVSTVPFFTQYPFIFNDLIRILTGRIIRYDIFDSQPSKQKRKRRHVEYIWQADSITVVVGSSRSTKKVRKILYYTNKGISWRIEYSSVRDGLCKEIYFESEGKNYFSLVFDEMEIQR